MHFILRHSEFRWRRSALFLEMETHVSLLALHFWWSRRWTELLNCSASTFQGWGLQLYIIMPGLCVLAKRSTNWTIGPVLSYLFPVYHTGICIDGPDLIMRSSGPPVSWPDHRSPSTKSIPLSCFPLFPISIPPLAKSLTLSSMMHHCF